MGTNLTYPDLTQAGRHALLRLWGDIEDTIAAMDTPPADMSPIEKSRLENVETSLRDLEFRVAFMFPEMRLWPEPTDHMTPRGNVIWVDPSEAPTDGRIDDELPTTTRLRRRLNKLKAEELRVHRDYRDRLFDEQQKKQRQAEKAKAKAAKAKAKKPSRSKPR